MPTYEYRCTDCSDFEQVHPMGLAPDVAPCPTCLGPARRRMSAPHLSAAGSPAYRLLESTTQSADAPQVVGSVHPGARSRAGYGFTANPLHHTLPRP